MNPPTNQQSKQRLGLHYFPDTLHYREVDLETWIPEFQKMGIRWLTLIAPAERAIPEFFIRGLLDAGIQPVLHFLFSKQVHVPIQSMRILLRSYARWGITAAALFDRPNMRFSWQSADWLQMDLVERFLDLYIPLADAVVEEGLVPIFPPLEPGGDYWDLSFLQSALQGMTRRCRPIVVSRLALGAYAWLGERALEWGMGGQDRWPEVKPYFTPPGSENHCGFRIFDWYSEIGLRELGRRVPIYLLRAGALPSDQMVIDQQSPDLVAHAQRNLSIANLFSSNETPKDSIPDEVVTCNFWLLSADQNSQYLRHAWFQPDREPLLVVNDFYRLAAKNQIIATKPSDIALPSLQNTPNSKAQPVVSKIIAEENILDDNEPSGGIGPAEFEDFGLSSGDNLVSTQKSEAPDQATSISHYVLLPLYAWGAADWDLSIIQPIIQESHPTIGFSLNEARLAQRVTVVGGEGAISDEALKMLQACGCHVERIEHNGTLVAS